MPFRNQDKSLTIPEGAGPNDPRVEINGDLPSAILANWPMGAYTVLQSVIIYKSANEYWFNIMVLRNDETERDFVVAGIANGPDFEDLSEYDLQFLNPTDELIHDIRDSVLFWREDTTDPTSDLVIKLSRQNIRPFTLLLESLIVGESAVFSSDKIQIRGSGDISNADDIPLVVGPGPSAAPHMRIDANEIQAMLNGSTGGQLRIGRLGGTVLIDPDTTFNGEIEIGDMAPVVASSTADLTGLSNTAYAAGTSVGMAFVAPISGRVKIELFVQMTLTMDSSNGRSAFSTVRVGTGAILGAGTAQAANGRTTPSDDDAMRVDSALSAIRVCGSGTSVYYLSGLTPGNTYNVQEQHRMSATSGASTYSTFHRNVIVTMLP